MKKILTIALVALLAASSVFAGFSGSASVGFGYNLEKRDFGFSNTNSTKLEYEITTGSAEIPAPTAEGEEATETPAIFAGIKGSFALKTKDAALSLDSKISEAYVGGADWKVSILGAADGLDYAASTIDTYYNSTDGKVETTTVAVSAAKAAGVKATYKDWTIGAGVVGGTNKVYTKNTDGYTAIYKYTYFLSKDDANDGSKGIEAFYGTAKDWENFLAAHENDGYCIAKEDVLYGYGKYTTDAEGNKLQACGAGANDPKGKSLFISKDNVATTSTTKVNTLDYSIYFATPSFSFGDFSFQVGAMAGDVSDSDTKEYLKKAELGFSAKAAYATDDISASVAGDVVLNGVGGADKIDVNYDGLLNVSYSSLVSLDVYYAKKANSLDLTVNKQAKKCNNGAGKLLSASAKIDLASFNVPVALTITGRNLLNEKRGLGAKIDASVSGFSFGASVEYALAAKTYVIDGSVGYSCDVLDANVGLKYYSSKELFASASVSSSSVVPGATLALVYSSLTDSNTGLLTSNLLKQKYGRVDATCTIKF